ITELSLPSTINISFPDSNNLLNFQLTIKPDEGKFYLLSTAGMYKDATFTFSFTVKPTYPHDPPKVLCLNKVYHPNIDLEGNVCLNILREDWKPVLSISSIVYGLQFLLLEPNPDDPLNKEAAEVLRSDRKAFANNVARALKGGIIGPEKFDKLY
ncbi:NEDD8-conjugating enzyme UBC12, partial [Rozella allomycis CSF55]